MVFDLSEQLKTPFQRRIYRLIGPALEKALGLTGFEACYTESSRLFKMLPQ
ncbi:MAG: hypothetical protein JWR15_4470, partial [Prosthecobacter sp.]|nr:hypothetical protein [Prosthecobacter sp.]